MEAGGERGRGRSTARPRLAAAAAGAGREGRLGRAAPGRAPRRLGLPVPQRALSRSRRHRGRGHGDGPRAPRVRRRGARGYDEAIARGVEWIAGLQSRNGGWAAFDADNVDHYLNNIPFADHGALLDPPTADVSARCVSMLAQLGETPDSPRMRAGARLSRARADGGRKLVRPLGRELHLRHLVGAVRARTPPASTATAPTVRKAADWLIAIQNADGGWGEDCTSYKLDYRGYEPAPSTASQTAWALLGLMAAGEVDHPAVARGIAYLQRTQDATGLWRQDAYTGGGFPRVFYLRYHGYPKFFPLWALARYRNLRRSQRPARRPRHVMILAVTGLQRERRIARRPRRRGRRRRRRSCAPGSGARPARCRQARGIISIGIAGGLAPGLRPGQWVVADCRARRRRGDADRSATGRARLAARLPEAARGLLLGANAMAADSGAEGRRFTARPARSRSTWNRMSRRGSRGGIGLPFAAARVISDAAHRTLPPAARVGMRRTARWICRPSCDRAAGEPWPVAGADPHRPRGGAGLSRLTPRPPPSWPPALAARISASFRSTWPEKTNSAGRWPSREMSFAIAPSVRTPRSATDSAFSGCCIMSFTAEASKPQWTMQSAHFSYLPTPYLSHSVSSMSSRKVLA